MQVNATIFHHSKHLDEGDLRLPLEACQFCGGTELVDLCSLQKAPDVTLRECAVCKAASASRMPTDDALSRFYGDYYVAGSAVEDKVTFHDVQRFGSHLASKMLPRVASVHVRMLDFGGGDGSLAIATAEHLLAAHVQAVVITVVDFNSTLATPRDGRITVKHEDDLEAVRDQRFDVVIASAILEHLPDPLPTLRQLLDLPAVGGVLYLRTPFMVPLMRLFKRFGLTLDFMFPGHVHDLGQAFWQHTFRSARGYTVLASKPSIVETGWRKSFFRTLAAWLLKAPWYVFGSRYALVGGWEVFALRTQETSEDKARAST